MSVMRLALRSGFFFDRLRDIEAGCHVPVQSLS